MNKNIGWKQIRINETCTSSMCFGKFQSIRKSEVVLLEQCYWNCNASSFANIFVLSFCNRETFSDKILDSNSSSWVFIINFAKLPGKHLLSRPFLSPYFSFLKGLRLQHYYKRTPQRMFPNKVCRNFQHSLFTGRLKQFFLYSASICGSFEQPDL